MGIWYFIYYNKALRAWIEIYEEGKFFWTRSSANTEAQTLASLFQADISYGDKDNKQYQVRYFRTR